MPSSTAERRAVDAATIAGAFRITAAQRAEEIAVRTIAYAGVQSGVDVADDEAAYAE